MTDRQTDRQTGELTGYPSIDRPWLKYYRIRPEEIAYPNKTLYQFVWDNNKDHPKDIVFDYFGRKINYQTFFDEVEKTARALLAMGIKAGDIVTIMSMHTPETIYTMYGLNYIGAAANFVYPTLTEKWLLQTIENTGSKALFILDAVLEKNAGIAKKVTIPIIVLKVEESMPLSVKIGYRLKKKKSDVTGTDQGNIDYQSFLEKGQSKQLTAPASDSAALAVIVYTSGTTGEPKGVSLSSDCINNMAIQDINGTVEAMRGETCLLILPPFIGFGVTQIHILVSAGIVSILQIVLEAETIIDRLFKDRPYVFLTGPALVSAFLNHKPGNLSNLKYFIGGGGAITGQQTAQINELLAKCHSTATYSNGYGMTEASSLLCASANEISKPGSVGIPILDTVVKIVDPDTGKELTYGETGELQFHCPHLMMGYYKNKEATDEIIYTDPDGKKWIRTGDLGTVDEDGFVFITGRMKRIYVTRSKDNMVLKLFPQHMEEVLMEVEEIAECGVVVSEEKKRIHIGIAFVAPKDWSRFKDGTKQEALRKKLFAHARANLPEHMWPAEIHIIEKMPVTASGKIDYRELERMYQNEKPDTELIV